MILCCWVICWVVNAWLVLLKRERERDVDRAERRGWESERERSLGREEVYAAEEAAWCPAGGTSGEHEHVYIYTVHIFDV